MRGMASAKPARKCPPDGTYPFNITSSAAGQTKIKNEGKPNQKGGDACVELALEVAEGEYAGYPAFDTLGTDGGSDFGAMSKKKWRALGVNVDTDAETPDEVIAAGLLNQRVFAVVEREPQQKLNEATGKWETVHDIDEQTGVKVPRYRLKIVGYVRQPTQQLGAPQQQQLAPQGQMPMAPGGFPGAPGMPQGFPPAPQAGGFPPAPGGFPQQQSAGFPGAPAGGPGGFPPAGPGGFPQVQAPQGWVQPGAPNGVPGAAPGMAPGFVPGQQPFPGAPGGQPPR